jgi:hypothetical protein
MGAMSGLTECAADLAGDERVLVDDGDLQHSASRFLFGFQASPPKEVGKTALVAVECRRAAERVAVVPWPARPDSTFDGGFPLTAIASADLITKGPVATAIGTSDQLEEKRWVEIRRLRSNPYGALNDGMAASWAGAFRVVAPKSDALTVWTFGAMAHSTFKTASAREQTSPPVSGEVFSASFRGGHKFDST